MNAATARMPGLTGVIAGFVAVDTATQIAFKWASEIVGAGSLDLAWIVGALETPALLQQRKLKNVLAIVTDDAPATKLRSLPLSNVPTNWTSWSSAWESVATSASGFRIRSPCRPSTSCRTLSQGCSAKTSHRSWLRKRPQSGPPPWGRVSAGAANGSCRNPEANTWP